MMRERSSGRSRGARRTGGDAVPPLAYFALWSFLGLVFASARYVDDLALGHDTSIADALAFGLVNWYVYALLAIPVVRGSARWPPTRATAWRRAPAYLLGSVLFSVVHSLVTHALWFERAGPAFLVEPGFRGHVVRHYHLDVLVFIGIVLFERLAHRQRQAHQRELERQRLEIRLARAQLDTLRAQLEPHFLFNSLNAVAATIHVDPESAHEMLTGVADLLRLVLDRSRRQEVTLREELAFVRAYAAVQATRFAGRLEVDIEAPEAALGARVPSLVLQPLVENAVRHGVGALAAGGRIRVVATLSNGTLRLCVADTGRGLAFGRRVEEGVGLSASRERLRHLYGDAGRLTLSNLAEGGCAAEVEIPLRTEPSPEVESDD